jgi:hypothetical protein
MSMTVIVAAWSVSIKEQHVPAFAAQYSPSVFDPFSNRHSRGKSSSLSSDGGIAKLAGVGLGLQPAHGPSTPPPLTGVSFIKVVVVAPFSEV